MRHNPELRFRLSRLGVLAILSIEFDVSHDYQVQRCRMSAMHQCTCSPLTLRWNSQFLGFYVCIYLFRHLYTLCCMFHSELILCLLHPLLWLDGQKKTHFAKELVQKYGRTVWTNHEKRWVSYPAGLNIGKRVLVELLIRVTLNYPSSRSIKAQVGQQPNSQI